MLPLDEVLEQVRSWIDSLNEYNALAPRFLRRFQNRLYQRAFGRILLEGRTAQLAGYRFSLAPVRSVNGIEQPTVLAINSRLQAHRPLKAFVGHRFISPVTKNLRSNLQLLFRAYGIQAWYSDSDTPNGPLFETILHRIQASDFCIFDDRETEIRPNVLIELGAAMALNKPYFYFNYQHKRAVVIGRKRERITTASDLSGMLHFPYSDYQVLFREFAMRLPAFLIDRGLGRIRK